MLLHALSILLYLIAPTIAKVSSGSSHSSSHSSSTSDDVDDSHTTTTKGLSGSSGHTTVYNNYGGTSGPVTKTDKIIIGVVCGIVGILFLIWLVAFIMGRNTSKRSRATTTELAPYLPPSREPNAEKPEMLSDSREGFFQRLFRIKKKVPQTTILPQPVGMDSKPFLAPGTHLDDDYSKDQDDGGRWKGKLEMPYGLNPSMTDLEKGSESHLPLYEQSASKQEYDPVPLSSYGVQGGSSLAPPYYPPPLPCRMSSGY